MSIRVVECPLINLKVVGLWGRMQCGPNFENLEFVPPRKTAGKKGVTDHIVIVAALEVILVGLRKLKYVLFKFPWVGLKIDGRI